MFRLTTMALCLGALGCGAAAGETPQGSGVEPDPPGVPEPEPHDAGETEEQQESPPVDEGLEETVEAPEPPPTGPLQATETEALLRITIISDTGEPIPGIIVTVENSAGRKFVSRDSDEAGLLELLVPTGDTYVARFVSLDENEITKQIPIPERPHITANFELTHTPARTRSFVLKGVFFATAKWTLKKESYANLENLLEFMAIKKTAIIRLEGHTDNVGDDQKNQILSRKRAEAVRTYLIKRGIAGARIEAVGYGESKPIASNETEEGRRTNRRTIVTIIKD